MFAYANAKRCAYVFRLRVCICMKKKEIEQCAKFYSTGLIDEKSREPKMNQFLYSSVAFPRHSRQPHTKKKKKHEWGEREKNLHTVLTIIS